MAFDGFNIWATDADAGRVHKVRVSDGEPLATVTLGASLYGIAFDGRSIWVSDLSTPAQVIRM